MPYVFVKRRFDIDGDMIKQILIIKQLRDSLPEIVARNLNVPEHPLTSSDIDVFFSDTEEFDKVTHGLTVIIQAHKYPERAALNLEHVAREIARDILEYTSPAQTDMAVWIQLLDGGYVGTPVVGTVQ